MNTTPATVRLAAAFASVVITFCLAATVDAMAKPPVPGTLLAQAAPTIVVR